MTIFTAVSSDKITHGMFVDYYRTVADKEVIVLEINSLFSSDTQITALKEAEDYITEHGKEDKAVILIKYRVKALRAKAGSTSVINETILMKSNYVLKFDMFSTHPEVLKSPDAEALSTLLSGWEAHVERLNK